MSGTYKLPQELRARLSEPIGRVFAGEQTTGPEFGGLVREARMVVTVGDRVTETIAEQGRPPDVQIIDGVERRVRREPPDVPFASLVRVKNPAGTITQEAIAGVRRAFEGKKPARVQVDGEEDLMAMLAIVMAPLRSVVFYGQPGVGIVAVEVDPASKSRSRAILRTMGIDGLGTSS